MRYLSLLLLLSCAKQTDLEKVTDAPLGDVMIEELPLWTNKYADTRADYGDYFKLSAIMERYGLNRFQAAEVQNHFRDQRRAEPTADVVVLFEEALRRVKAGTYESGLDYDKLQAGRFTVVFDLDETLYDQYYSSELAAGCHDLHFQQSGKDKYIKLAPDWVEVFETVRELDGRIVLFSANLDERTIHNTREWTWEDKPLTEHPDIAGIFTNSYLVMQDKSEGSKKNPILVPSKDLRLFDENLRDVIIVDDNPSRLFQPANSRVTRKFHADEWCEADIDEPFKNALGGELGVVADEIRDSVTWLDANTGASFQTAYLPYTTLGRIAVDAFVSSNEDWDRAKAIAYVRAHPHTVDTRF